MKKKTHLTVVCFIILGSIIGLSAFSHVYTASYRIINQKLTPVNNDPQHTPVPNEILVQAILNLQQDNEKLRTQINQRDQEISALNEKVAELDDSLKRFKNYYFRRF